MRDTGDVAIDEGALQRGELQLCEAVGTAHGVDGEQVVPGMLRVVRALPDFLPVAEVGLHRLRDGDQVFHLRLDRLAFVDDADGLLLFDERLGGFLEFQPIALHLGPDERLGPVDPGSAQLDLVAGELAAEGTPAEAIARFQDHRLVAVFHAVARCGHAGEAAADDHHVVVAIGILRLALLSRYHRADLSGTHRGHRAGSADHSSITEKLAAAYAVTVFVSHIHTFHCCRNALRQLPKHARAWIGEIGRRCQ
ncbi:hypothetical protein D3C81_1409190 [compost metagenome]